MGVFSCEPLANDLVLDYVGSATSEKELLKGIRAIRQRDEFGAWYALTGLLVDSYNIPSFTINDSKAKLILDGVIKDSEGNNLITESSIAWLSACTISLENRKNYLLYSSKQLYNIYKTSSFSNWTNPLEIRTHVEKLLNESAAIVKSNYSNPIKVTSKYVKELVHKSNEDEAQKKINRYEDNSIILDSITKNGIRAYSIYSRDCNGNYCSLCLDKELAIALLKNNKIREDRTGLSQKFGIQLNNIAIKLHCTHKDIYHNPYYDYDKNGKRVIRRLSSLYTLVMTDGSALRDTWNDDNLKEAIRAGEFIVDNLTLTKDNRLVESVKGSIIVTDHKE